MKYAYEINFRASHIVVLIAPVATYFNTFVQGVVEAL